MKHSYSTNNILVTRSRNWRHKSIIHVSCKSRTVFVWYRIPAPTRTLFYSNPESGTIVTEMIIYDSFLTFRQNIHVYFRRRKFLFQTYMVRKTSAENRRQKWSQFMCTGFFWSACHGYNNEHYSCRKETARCLHVACEVNFTRSYFDEGSLITL